MNLRQSVSALAFVSLCTLASSCWEEEWYVDHHPRPARACTNDQHCWSGYFCDRDERVCRPSAYCYHNRHCPSRYVCDFRGTCVPTKPFSPRGDGGVVADGGPSSQPPIMTDAGVPGAGGASGGGGGGGAGPAPVGGMSGGGSGGAAGSGGGGSSAHERCQYNSQCGPGGRCIGGLCQRGCTSASACGTGESCQQGLCQPLAGNACVFNGDCLGGGTCVNGHCHARCEEDGACANGADMCDLGLCRPDVRPRPQCRGSAECADGWSCVNGVCRTPCRDDSGCGEGCSGTVCLGGHCVLPQEVTPQCRLSSDCAAGAMCVDALCQ